VTRGSRARPSGAPAGGLLAAGDIPPAAVLARAVRAHWPDAPRAPTPQSQLTESGEHPRKAPHPFASVFGGYGVHGQAWLSRWCSMVGGRCIRALRPLSGPAIPSAC